MGRLITGGEGKKYLVEDHGESGVGSLGEDDDISRPGDKSDATEDRGVVSKSSYPSTPYHEYEDNPWA